MRLILFIVLFIFSSLAYATDYCNDSKIVGCYPSQENTGTTLVDHSSQSYTGTFASSGHPAWVTQSPSRSYLTYATNYTTTSDYIRFSLPSVTFVPTQAQSEVLWVYPTVDTVSGGNPRIIDDTTAHGNSFINVSTTSTIIFQVGSNGGTSLVSKCSNSALTLSAWNHVAVTWDGSNTATNVHIYINGSECSYQQQTNGSSLESPNATLEFGNRRSDNARPLNGYLTEIGLFNRVLSSSEVTDIYNNGLIQGGAATNHGFARFLI